MTTSLAPTQHVELLREVADGPMAVLFAGERVRGGLPSLVAVKVLRRGRAPDKLARARDAGRALACLSHRHIVTATELALVDDRPALMGPWIEGLDLLDWVEILRETGTVLPGRVVCEIVRAAASALDAALNRTPWGAPGPLGLLHRDMKPSNLMVDRDGELRVLDFCSGVSSLAPEVPAAEAMRAGWAKYWCPQRRQGADARPESDVYALGVLAIELFRGGWLRRVRNTNPAHDRHLAEVVAALPDPGLRGAEDDRALKSLLLRMVAYDPEARPSAVVVAQTLRTLGDRASGPILESFAHDHALPYIEPPLPVPGLPDARVVELSTIEALPPPEEPELLGDSYGHPIGSTDDDDDDEDSTGTERVAEATAKALRDYRRMRAAKHTMQIEPEPQETDWVEDADLLLAAVQSDEVDRAPRPAEPTPAPRDEGPTELRSAPPPLAAPAKGPGRSVAIVGALGGLGVVGAGLVVVAGLLIIVAVLLFS